MGFKTRPFALALAAVLLFFFPQVAPAQRPRPAPVPTPVKPSSAPRSESHAAASTVPTPADEAAALDGAQVVFNDGLFDVVESRLAAFIRQFPKSTLMPRARLLEGRALYYLGRFDAAAPLLDGLEVSTLPLTESQRAESLFWRGETALARGRWAEAQARYDELLAQFPADPHVSDAQLGRGWALLKQDRETDALKQLNDLATRHASDETGRKATLLLARYDMARNQADAARTRLQPLLAQQPRAASYYEAAFLLGEIEAAAGRGAQASAYYEKVTGDELASPKALVARAWFGLGQTERSGHDLETAMGAFEHAFTLADDEALKISAYKSFLDVARERKLLPESIAKLQEFAKKAGPARDTGASLYAIGLVEADAHEDKAAVATLESLIKEHPDSRWRGPAYYQLGRLYQAANDWDNATKALTSCLGAAITTDPTLARRAQLELGNIAYKKGDFDAAAIAYDKVIGVPDDIAHEAWSNLLFALANQKKIDVFLKSRAAFVAAFPRSPQRARVAVQEAEMLEDAGRFEEAKRAYREAFDAGTDSTAKASALVRLGDLLATSDETRDMEEAVQIYQQVGAQFPDEPLAAEASSKAILAELPVKKITPEKEVDDLMAINKKFPTGPQAANILFHVGEIYYQRGDFVNAEGVFETLARDYPQSDLADEALYFAGLSAFKHGDLPGAMVQLDKVPATSPLKNDARLLQGKVQHRLLNFGAAIALFDSIANSVKTGPQYVEAMLRKGDCYLGLGTKDTANYEQAAATFGVLINAGKGNFPQRNEAGFKRAKALEKLDRKEDALALYLDVLYGRLRGTPRPGALTPAPISSPAVLPKATGTSAAATAKASTNTPTATVAQKANVLPAVPAPAAASGLAPDPNAPEADCFWQIKAGLEAALMKQQQSDWRGAIQIYRRLEQLGGPSQQDFHDMVTKIRRDNFIYE